MALEEYDMRKVSAFIFGVAVLVCGVLYVLSPGIFAGVPGFFSGIWDSVTGGGGGTHAPGGPTGGYAQEKRESILAKCLADDAFKDKAVCVDRGLLIEANNNLDKAYCELVEDKKVAVSCAFQIVQKKALANEDPTVCDELSGSQRTDCIDLYYAIMAATKKRVDYCDRITATAKADQCWDKLLYEKAIEEKNCGLLRTSEKRNLCFYSVAVGEKNAAMCGSIQDSGMKRECLDKVNLENG